LPKWFRRLGDIPGLGHECPEWIDRSRLPGFNAVPREYTVDLGDRRIESLSWPRGDGEATSASPVHARAYSERSNYSSGDIVRNVYEGLELPGEPSDYHFLLQGSASQLWSLRRAEPRVIAEVEKLCWLDIHLIEACPSAASDGDDRGFYSILTFGTLIEIYEREGFLAEAVSAAELAARFGQGDAAKERLTHRIDAVKSETTGAR
jgi:hypothetical protein